MNLPFRCVVATVAVVGTAFLGMTAWTWRGWCDPLIDFGRELYVAWQVSRGAVLYQDVAYFNGPLSPHVNALLFHTFGEGLMTLAWANLLACAGIVGLVCRLAWRSCDPDRPVVAATATSAAGVMVCAMFAFAQYVDVGNYNYVTPYSHELTHGLLLSLLSMAAALRAGDAGGATTGRPNPVWAGVSGGLLGLVFLTKPEIFAAAVVAVVVATLGMLRRPGAGRATLTLGVMACVVPILAWLLLRALAGLSSTDALRGVLGGWWYAFDPALRNSPFYRAVSGLDDPVGNTTRALLTALAYAAGLGAFALVDRATRRPGRRSAHPLSVAAGAGAVVLASWGAFALIPWNLLFYGAPLAVGMALVTTAWRARRDGLGPARLARLTLAAFALAMLAKIILRPVVWQYGFALMMPAAVVMTLATVAWFPGWLARRAGGSGGDAARAMGVTTVAVVVAVHLGVFGRQYADKPVTVATGADAFRAAGARARATVEALRQIEATVPAGATLSAMPEGATLNYLSRRVNPTPYITLLPPEFVMFGAARIVDAYRAAPPDFVVIVPTDLAQYGSEGFDRDYAAALAEWVRAHYEPVAPPVLEAYPIRLLRRVDKQADAGRFQPSSR